MTKEKQKMNPKSCVIAHFTALNLVDSVRITPLHRHGNSSS
uniref:Uncharacterized protein n=1 Tax=Rhizophora mucronata TaxID=61149 RepID=A0A2P2PXR0_RHIMU